MAEEKTNWYERSEIAAIVAILVLVSNQFLGIEVTESDFQETLEAVGIAIAGVIALVGNYFNRHSKNE